MEHLRTVLFIALGGICLLIWQAWREDQAQQALNEPVPHAGPPALSEPATGPEPQAHAAASLPAAATPQEPARAGRLIRVRTDLLEAAVDTTGATLAGLDLLTYPVSADRPDEPYRMLARDPDRTFYVQGGLVGEGMPDHRATFQAAADAYTLTAGQDHLEVPLSWEAPDGTVVRKVYTFQRGSYVVDLRYEIQAPAGTAQSARPYTEIVRSPGADAGRSIFNPVSFQGGAIYTQADKFDKFGFDDMGKKPLDRAVTDGWVAQSEHYFVAALMPQDGRRRCHTRALPDNRYAIGCVADTVIVAPGQQVAYANTLYLGPKEHDRLAAAAPGLGLTVDFGMLTVIAQPLFWLLRHIEQLVGNWGLAIILLTALIKLAFYRLSATSYRSMAQLRNVQPRMLELRERYKDDREKLNEKMMELYRNEKVNPLGGCLPIVVQIPVFIALYWVLLESVELRHAPFFGWIQDLSSKDPYFVLPILMGASMVIQQRMTPMSMEPIQQRMMMALPVVFTVFFAFFPAGLVLYWLVNNVLSITQQWYITRRMAASAPA